MKDFKQDFHYALSHYSTYQLAEILDTSPEFVNDLKYLITLHTLKNPKTTFIRKEDF